MSELTKAESGSAIQSVEAFDDEMSSLLMRTIAKGCSVTQFALFGARCSKTKLDPISRQIYPVLRKNRKTGDMDMTIQVGIDGLRLIAQRTGEYEGQGAIEWCGLDGQWKDIWLDTAPPAAARASVFRKGFRQPLARTVLYKSYCQMYQGSPMGLWKTMPEHMLGKCAEAAAIRAAFPQETAGLYTADEMAQADTVDVSVVEVPRDAVGADNNVRFRELAKEVGMKATQIKAIAQSLGLPVKVSELTPEQTEALIDEVRSRSEVVEGEVVAESAA